MSLCHLLPLLGLPLPTFLLTLFTGGQEGGEIGVRPSLDTSPCLPEEQEKPRKVGGRRGNQASGGHMWASVPGPLAPDCFSAQGRPSTETPQPDTAAMGVHWRSAGPTRSGGSSGALRRVAKAGHSPLFSRGDPLNPTSHLAASPLTSHCSSLSPPPGLHYQTRCWTPRSHSRRCSCCPRRSRTRGLQRSRLRAPVCRPPWVQNRCPGIPS